MVPIAGGGANELAVNSGDGAKAAVSSYLDALRSRSLAARVNRSAPGGPLRGSHATPAAIALAQASGGGSARPPVAAATGPSKTMSASPFLQHMQPPASAAGVLVATAAF